MIDFEKARLFAFNELSKFNNVKLLKEKDKFGYEGFVEVWTVITEIELRPNNPEDFEFHICIKSDFPISFPWVYLSQKDYDRIKYIPHVDTERQICTYDREIIRFNTDNPHSIVYNCLKKAKEIIIDGIIKKTNLSDFDEEFLAYWNNSYSKNDKINNYCLSLLSNVDSIKSKIGMFFVQFPENEFNYIFHQHDYLYERFKKYFKECKLRFSEHDILYLGEIDHKKMPSFDLVNSEAIEIVTKMGQLSEFRNYLKRKDTPAIVLFKKIIGKKEYFLGWSHDDLELDKSGFTKWERISLTTINNHANVTRLNPCIYLPERLAERTSGDVSKSILKFLVAGLGSIGSNLIYFLNSLNTPEFSLVDTDILKIENIGRHLLGFSCVNNPKIIAIENFLHKQNPHQKIQTEYQSIVEIVQHKTNIVNDVDYVFVAIGTGNVQSWLGDAFKNKVIKKPIFFLWVEPYLVAGHCIYLHPNDNKNYEETFDSDGFFNFNIIDKEEYTNGNKALFMKEAGCQSSYVPYALSNIVLFLSQLFPVINSIIQNNIQHSASYTWFGSQTILRDKQIKTSKYGDSHKQGEVVRNDI
ncbi:MAG: E2/UBC family protein [Phycisphaerae bacterium]|jgi:hypothetical protein